MLRVVLFNLNSNGLKFTHKRAESERSQLFVRGGASHLFFIHDNDTGFVMQCAGKLFGLFQPLHASDELKGIGIGLPEGKVGGGARFHVSLPHVADKEAMHDKLNHF